MKFNINSSSLAETVAAAISSLPSKTTAPIMNCVLIEAQIGAVTMSSFNYDRATIRVAPADVMDTETVAVAGRLLAVVAGNLPKDADTTVVVDGNELSVSAGRTSFKLPLMRADDYPHLPVMDSRDAIGSIDRDTFTEAVRVIGGFASTETLPANLTALNMTFGAGELLLRATDRYIIGHRRLEWSGGDASVNVAAADVLPAIKALTGHGASDVDVLWNGSMVGFRTNTTTTITRTLDLEGDGFPDTGRALTTKQYFSAITVPLGDLSAMLKRAMAIADDQNAQVRLEITDGVLGVATTKSSVGGISDAIPGKHHGGCRNVAVSARRLAAALAAIDNSEVTVALRESGLHIHLHPGPIEGFPAQPDTDSVALVAGIKSA